MKANVDREWVAFCALGSQAASAPHTSKAPEAESAPSIRWKPSCAQFDVPATNASDNPRRELVATSYCIAGGINSSQAVSIVDTASSKNGE